MKSFHPIERLLRGLTDLFVFHPERGQRVLPSDLGIPYQHLWLTASDGVRTEAWWMPSSQSAGPLWPATILTFHGNAGTMADRLDWCREALARGASVLAVEYRGYGNSDGRPSEDGLRRDALVAFERARELAAEQAGPLLVHGRSLGGAVAIGLAAEVSPDGLVAESTFTSIAEMAVLTAIPFAARLATYRFESIVSLPQVAAPVFLVHGRTDELIPFAMGEALRDARQSAGVPVHFLEVTGGEHNGAWRFAGEEYWQQLAAWYGAEVFEIG